MEDKKMKNYRDNTELMDYKELTPYQVKRLNELNTMLNDLAEYIKMTDIFNMTDLKLYKLFFALDDIGEQLEKEHKIIDVNWNNEFYNFCDFAFKWFIDDLSTNGIDFEKTIERIGRTSKFYPCRYEDSTPQRILINWTEDKYPDLLECCDIVRVCHNYYFQVYDTEYFNWIIEDHTTLEIYEELMEGVKDSEIISSYIRDYKENCIEYFIEDIECNIDNFDTLDNSDHSIVYVDNIEHSINTDQESVFESLAGDLVRKYILKSNGISRIKHQTILHNGFSKITVYYSNNTKTVYTVKL